EIQIEERDPDEVTTTYGKAGDEFCTVQTGGINTAISNYAFDVTPARLVTGLITERGICAASEDGLTTLFPEQADCPDYS
ncbi:MAG: hypothetical protein ACE1Y4_16160, partial [Lysobacterales bacterium]